MDALTLLISGLSLLAVFSLIFIYYDILGEVFIGLTRHLRFSRQIHQYARKNDYLLINNVLLPLGKGKYFRIDHLLFGDRYIYVIASKLYRGQLTGTYEDSQWLLKDEHQMKTMDNPLKMNHQRAGWLSQMLSLPEDRFINLVVIAKTAVFDKIPSDSTRDVAFAEKDLARIINLFEKSVEMPKMAPAEIESLTQKVFTWTKKTKALGRYH